MSTPIAERLGIEFPLFAFSHCRDVVAAVSKAGGYGVLGALWQLATCLREQRGDGHVATQASVGLDPVEMHLIYALGSGFPGDILRQSRDWTEDEWAEGVARLVDRGLLVDATTVTDEGRVLHEHIETTTDDLALRALVAGIGDADAVLALADELTPLARAISGSGILPFPNPTGIPAD